MPEAEGHTYRVIGGAGGSMNYLKLRGVKSGESYRQAAADAADKRRLARQAQTDADKKSGIYEAKQQARENINDQKREAESQFIQQVAHAMGWGDKQLEPDLSGLSPAAAKKAARLHHAALLRKAKQAVSLQKQAIFADEDAAAAIKSGAVSLSTSGLSVADLDPVKPDLGPTGVSPDFGARAAANGLTQEGAKAEAAALQGKEQADDAAKAAKGEKAAAIRDELAAANLPTPDELPVKVAALQDALGLLAAEKKLRAVAKAATAANAEIDASSVEPKAYVLEVAPVDADQVAADVMDGLRTATAASFLARVKDAGGDDAVVPHVATGAFNALNSAALVAGGASMMDRSVVDVLGVAGAAAVLARRFSLDLGPEGADELRQAVEKWHVARQEDLAKGAMAKAAELHELAAGAEKDATEGDDLLLKAAASRRKVEALAEAQRVLGQALGELEAGASLALALKEGRDSVEVSLGRASLESAITKVRALGLLPGEYDLTRQGANVFLQVTPAGLSKLAAPVDKEAAARAAANLALLNGAQDEDGWLPAGFANRPDLALHLPEGVVPSIAAPFAADAPDLAASLRDYVGGRYADGDSPGDILMDVQSAAFFEKVGAARAAEYRAALDAVLPNKGAGKKMRTAADFAPLMHGYAEDYAAKLGGSVSTLNSQAFEATPKAQDAVWRALADVPEGVAGYKAVSDLTPQDQGALRGWFAKNVAKDSPEAADLRSQIEKLQADEPEKMVEADMFGEAGENPAWAAWNSQVQELRSQLRSKALTWGDYVKVLGSPSKAYEAVQDLVRSQVAERFAHHHNTLEAGSPLRVGRTTIRNSLGHLSAVDPDARAERMAQDAKLRAALQERAGGKFAGGSVKAKVEAQQAHMAGMAQAQMGFFAAEDLPPSEKPLAPDERVTIGQAAEKKLAAMVGAVGGRFKPGEPVKLFQPSMSGPDGVVRQRAIKHIVQNKRTVLAAGVGTGKTGIGLGAFAQLHSDGKAKRGLFVVPSIVQGQFNAEALRFLEPGRFDWHADPGASAAERLAAMKDPSKDFVVVTHQALRDDMLSLLAAKQGVKPADAAAQFDAMPRAARAALLKQVMAEHGMAFDYVMADEAHGLLDRQGKADSRLSETAQALTDNVPYYVHASADPTKNDVSELQSLYSKMDGARYGDRDAFMRAYGGDTAASRDALKRLMLQHVFTASVKPDVKVTRSEVNLDLNDAQLAAAKKVRSAVARARLARLQGKLDVAACRELAPEMFAGLEPGQEDEAARRVTSALGVIRDSALRRAVDNHEDGVKMQELSKQAAARAGRKGVVFSRFRSGVDAAAARLTKDGRKVVTITGSDSSEEKARKLDAYRRGDYDVIVASDAGATGANMQTGSWLVQLDTPDTAMTHAQRQGRVDRIGQENDVDLIDLIHNTPEEARARERLATKYDLRELTTSPLEGLDDSGLAYFLKQQQAQEQQASLL